MSATLTEIVNDHLAGRCEVTPAGHCTCSNRYAEVLAPAADEPAKVERPAKVRETYTVEEADLLEFRHEARRAGMTIVLSSPVGGGYSVTIEH